jgi:hypothetical protein
MRELASLGRARTLVRKIRTFSDVLLVTLKSASTVSEHSKVTADALSSTHTDMWEQTMIAGAPSVVGKVHAEWRALRSRIVGEIAAVSGVGTLAL